MIYVEYFGISHEIELTQSREQLCDNQPARRAAPRRRAGGRLGVNRQLNSPTSFMETKWINKVINKVLVLVVVDRHFVTRGCIVPTLADICAAFQTFLVINKKVVAQD